VKTVIAGIGLARRSGALRQYSRCMANLQSGKAGRQRRDSGAQRSLGIALLLGTALAGCAGGGDSPAGHRATLERHCLDCHNDAEATGGLTLESLDPANVGEAPEIWENVVRKLRAGMMPPAEGVALDAAQRTAFVDWLETQLDAASLAHPNPGRTVAFHRLNRAEYSNAVRDLLGVEIDAAQLLPGDDSSYGFDNIAGVLKVSPTLMERYLKAADEVSRRAVGLPAPVARIDYFRVPDDRSQEQRLPGMPFGTRGGMQVRYTFPVDGEYEIAPRLQRDLNEQLPLYAEAQQLEVSIDGERIGLFTLDAVPVSEPEAAGTNSGAGAAINQIARSRLTLSRTERALRNRADDDWAVRVPVSAGARDVVLTFLSRTAALDETPRLPFLRPYPAGVNIPETRTGAYLRSFEISGPFATTGRADALAGRAAVFVCEPREAAAVAPVERACAQRILTQLARLAWRRPVEAAEIEPLMAFFAEGAAQARAGETLQRDFDGGIALAIKRLLVSPEFLFRIERDPENVGRGPYDIDATTLASRLSFFLWSSIPDEELLSAAESGRLLQPDELERQVARMLADERSRALVENFAGQWLFLRNLEAIVPVQSVFPDFDDTLRQGLRRETELFFWSIVREDRSVLDLLSADYTFVNERVARHYGMNEIKGSHFRRVQYPADSGRRGLLGHGSILAVTSYPDRTSPVVRGKWILENLLGAPPPDPPPDVPGLAATDGAGSAISMRERLARHRDNPNCASCHALMDPLGFALENFDAVGRWRTLGDAGQPIDAGGALPDGTEFDGVAGLRAALLSSDLFVTTMTEKLLTYALGRGVEYYDMPAVRRIVREARAAELRFSSLILGIVMSAPFRQRMPAGEMSAAVSAEVNKG
jgi:mono/diheme cytochrome c family protein